jgi:hypothetical protein
MAYHSIFLIPQCSKYFIIIFGLWPEVIQPNDAICHFNVELPNAFNVIYACKNYRTSP